MFFPKIYLLTIENDFKLKKSTTQRRVGCKFFCSYLKESAGHDAEGRGHPDGAILLQEGVHPPLGVVGHGFVDGRSGPRTQGSPGDLLHGGVVEIPNSSAKER